jgi:hypothetical protein
MERAPHIEQEPKHEGPQKYLEDVATRVNELHVRCKTQHRVPAHTKGMLHREISQTELHDIFSQYENGKTLTFAHLNESVRILNELLEKEITEFKEGEYAEELKVMQRLLAGRGKELRSAAHRYIGTLVKFVSVVKQKVRLQPEEFVDRMERADRERRTAHEGIIASLKTYVQLVERMESDGLLEGYRIEEWYMGQPVVAPDAAGKVIPVFSPRFLADRDMVKDWAVCADLHEMLEDIGATEEAEEKP